VDVFYDYFFPAGAILAGEAFKPEKEYPAVSASRG
jgi:hypothetical protein